MVRSFLMSSRFVMLRGFATKALSVHLTGGGAIGNVVLPLSFFGHCMVLERISSLAESRRP